jgi:hypothetical protein
VAELGVSLPSLHALQLNALDFEHEDNIRIGDFPSLAEIEVGRAPSTQRALAQLNDYGNS